MGASVRPAPTPTTPDEDEFQAWKRAHVTAPAAPVAPSVTPQTPDEAEFQAWKAKNVSAPTLGHGTPVETPSGVDFRGAQGSPDNPIRMNPVVVGATPSAKPASNAPTAPTTPHAPATAINDPVKAAAAPTMAPSDATRLRPEKNPQAHQLTGLAKKASDVFESMANNPVTTALALPLAPLKSAFTAGRYLGQQISEDPAADADASRSLGIDPVTGKEAAIAGAQTALMAGGAGLLGKLAGRAVGAGADAAGASPVVAKGLAGTAHVVTEGGSIGAAYDPEHPARGAAIGAGLGVLANEAGGVLRRRILPLPEVDAVPAAVPAERGLPSGNPTPTPTAARVVEEPVGAQTAAPAEPDFAVEQTPQHDALEQEFEAWKRAQGKTPPAPVEAPAVEPPAAVIPKAESVEASAPAPASEGVAAPAASVQAGASDTVPSGFDEQNIVKRDDGAPLVVYHGTRAGPFATFRTGTAAGWGRGIYFTDNQQQATDEFGDGSNGRVIAAHVSMRNPYRGETIPAKTLEGTEAWKAARGQYPSVEDAWHDSGPFAGAALRELGYDGVIADQSNGINGKEVVAFHPTQVRMLDAAPAVQAEPPASINQPTSTAPTYKPDNPFAEKALAARARADRLLGQRSAHDEGMGAAFPLGAGFSRPGSEKRIDRSVNHSVEVVKAIKDADYLEAQAKAFDAGKITAQGRSRDAASDQRSEKAATQREARDAKIAAAKLLSDGKARWQVPGSTYATATGYLAGSGRNLILADHDEAVAAALAAGHRVPDEVLAEYPHFDETGNPRAVSATPLPTSATPAPIESALPAGRVLDEDGVVRHESARTPGGTLRPVGRVSTPGLLDELLNLERKRAKDEALAPYELKDDENFHTSGIPQIVSTKQQNGRGSVQSEALQRLKGYAGVTDRIHAELATRMPESDVWSALEDRRAMHDERAGLAGQFEPGAMGRQPIRDASDKVLFARASGGGSTRGARASAVQGRDLFGNAPEPSPADQTSLFGGTAGTEGARSLAETERAAHAELAQLREKLPRTRPDARAPIAARIAELEKLVNRGKAITPDELRVRAAAESAAQSPSPPTAGTARPGPSPTEEPTLFARAAAPPRAGQPGPRGPSHAPPGVEPADVPSPKASRAEPPPKVAAGRLAKFVDDIKVDLAPHTRSEEAGRMARITNAHTGAQAQQLEQAHEALRSFAKSFDRMSEATQLDFIDRLEHGLPQETPALTRAAALIRGLLDTARDEIRALGTGKLEQWLEDYFPHIWKDPEAAAPIIGRILGKRPLEGPKSFLKKRTIPTTKEGIAAGLVPVTTNPVDLTLLKLKEMRRYLAAHRILQEAEADGLLKYVPATEMGPQGWRKIEDRIGTVYGKPTVEASEAFDKQVRQGLEAAIERLTGLSHERRARTGKRGALGYAKGADEMVTKFGTDDGVMMHELGHILDARYGLWRRLASDPRTVGELQDLAKLRHESGEAKPSFTKYVQKPEEQIANALHALLHAPERMAEVAPATKALLERFLASKPELKPLLDIKPSLELATGTTEIPVAGLVVRGHYWAPEPVTNVLANYLSPGLRGKAWYGLYGGLNNGLNQAQLGLSAFHVGFTSLDAMVSQFADGLQHLVHGRGLTGVGKMATYPAAPVTTMLRGHRLMRAYLNPETASPELVRMVRAITEAGGRAKQDSFYQTGQAKAFMQALRRASAAPLPRARELLKGTAFDNAVGEAALRFVPALFDAAAKPVMEFVVPRQKLGVFMQMAQRALDDLPEGATVDDTRKALNRAWDSVDNRLGQLVYDRLFWNKTFKDLAMVSVRSVGWNLGTLREIGGGSVDLVKMANDAFHGRRPDVTERASYNIALPLVLGLSTAIGTYLLTGEGPKELKDYYTIRTGKQNVEGNEERMQLPSYMKDIVAYKRHPVTTVEHKVAPAMAMIVDMLHNEDFYGDQIRNADDPFVQQMGQVTTYLLKGAIPFGIRNAQEAGRRVVDPRMKVAGFVGVTAAPREETRTPAENKMMEYLATKAPPGATPEARDARTARSDLMTAAREGTLSPAALDQAQTAGALSDRQRRAIEQVQDGEGDVWLSRFNRLSADEALRVYKLATPTEQAKYREALESKLIRADREDELDQLPPLHVSSTSAGRP